MVSRALNNISPFSDEVLGLNTSKMNFILHMYAEDHPDEYRLIDPDIPRGENPVQIYNAWLRVLTGDARKEFERNPPLYLKKYYKWVKNGN